MLFSDGVSEAMNATEDFYGEERLLRRWRRAGATAAELVATVMADVGASLPVRSSRTTSRSLAARYAPAKG